MGLKRRRFRCGWRTLWVLDVCMVEIGRVRVKTGNAAATSRLGSIEAASPRRPSCRKAFYAGGFDRLMKEVVTLGSGLIFDQGQRSWCAYIARRLEILG